MFMVITATLMITIFMVVFSDVYQDNLQDKKRLLAEDLGYALQTELIIAAQAKDGYHRTFEVPTTLDGHQYHVWIQGSVLFLNNTLGFPIPKVEGIIKKGSNSISKVNNTICLNC